MTADGLAGVASVGRARAAVVAVGVLGAALGDRVVRADVFVRVAAVPRAWVAVDAVAVERATLGDSVVGAFAARSGARLGGAGVAVVAIRIGLATTRDRLDVADAHRALGGGACRSGAVRRRRTARGTRRRPARMRRHVAEIAGTGPPVIAVGVLPTATRDVGMRAGIAGAGVRRAHVTVVTIRAGVAAVGDRGERARAAIAASSLRTGVLAGAVLPGEAAECARRVPA